MVAAALDDGFVKQGVGLAGADRVVFGACNFHFSHGCGERLEQAFLVELPGQLCGTRLDQATEIAQGQQVFFIGLKHIASALRPDIHETFDL